MQHENKISRGFIPLGELDKETDKMSGKIYGAYGSNMNLEQMAHRCPKAKVIGKGILKDYKLTFRGRYKGVANIEKCKGKVVPIVLWEITDECESALDIYEGYPSLYEKEDIKVIVGDKVIKAMVYIMTKEYTHMAAVPTEYYFNVIAKGYEDNAIKIEPLELAYEQCLKEINK